jgi:predicted transcriptional regulator of viral defense system
MKLQELKQISKPYFGYEEISRILKINPNSAKVSAGRYVKQGLLLRIKNNMYLLKDFWNRATVEEKFLIANIAQTPSYISLTTALSFYETTTQVQRNFIESIANKKSNEIKAGGDVLRYFRIKPDLYFGFRKQGNFFIASPEKALLDAFYLMSFGRYSLDISALDKNKFNMKQIEQLSQNFPLKTINLLVKHGYLKAA